MKNTMTSLSLLLAGSLLVNVALADDFNIHNDWFIEGINKPAKLVITKDTYEDGYELYKRQSSFGTDGFITEVIFDDSLQQIFELYQGKTRNVAFIYDVEGETQQNPLTISWLDQNHLRFDDGDLVMDSYFDPQGKILRNELFMNSMEKPDEIRQYYYLATDETKPTDQENFIFVTNLKVDQYGNWIKQKEEKPNDKPIIRTRTIEYFP